MLHSKKILLGVCGSIAAYKSAFLIRLLIKAGASVKTIMTSSATAFITPLTLSTLSKNPVLIEFTEKDSWNNHVELGLWADMMLIAPASANTIAKMATGICDNLLLATYLSARCPVIIVPAMDEDMWKHPSTKKNMESLIGYGNKIISVEHGDLASGLIGEGRMAEPEVILRFLKSQLRKGNEKYSFKKKLQGKRVLVTAGPTQEPIDPVRYISNYSSGKMGVSIANELAENGAQVTLIMGPSEISLSNPKIKIIYIQTAREMLAVCIKEFRKTDITVMAAAVADFTPMVSFKEKIKKDGKPPIMKFVNTKDILKELGKLKTKNQILIGFALETENEIINAKKKLKEKNLDAIIVNSLKDKGAGFRYDTNKITIIDKHNKITAFELKTKKEVASDIIDKIVSLY